MKKSLTIEGTTLKELRKTAKLTQEELADKVGVDAKTVSAWECGRQNIHSDYFITLCRLAGKDMSEFVDINDKDNQDTNVIIEDLNNKINVLTNELDNMRKTLSSCEDYIEYTKRVDYILELLPEFFKKLDFIPSQGTMLHWLYKKRYKKNATMVLAEQSGKGFTYAANCENEAKCYEMNRINGNAISLTREHWLKFTDDAMVGLRDKRGWNYRTWLAGEVVCRIIEKLAIGDYEYKGSSNQEHISCECDITSMIDLLKEIKATDQEIKIGDYYYEKNEGAALINNIYKGHQASSAMFYHSHSGYHNGQDASWMKFDMMKFMVKEMHNKTVGSCKQIAPQNSHENRILSYVNKIGDLKKKEDKPVAESINRHDEIYASGLNEYGEKMLGWAFRMFDCNEAGIPYQGQLSIRKDGISE